MELVSKSEFVLTAEQETCQGILEWDVSNGKHLSVETASVTPSELDVKPCIFQLEGN